jgi:NADPH-dependent ferric siderophore reductase
VVESLLDREALPWQADWYRSKVREHLGSAIDEHFRLWFTDNALHGDDELQESPLHTVSYLGILHQALRDLSRWVEEGVAPAAGTSYEVVDGQVVVPADATHRRGIQPVVSLTVNGDVRADATTGSELTFRAVAEVPEGTGLIVEVAWDFDGSGRFSEAEPVAAATEVVVERRRSFAEAGTTFPAVRVVAQRDGNPTSPFARLQNLARVRVVVGDPPPGCWTGQRRILVNRLLMATDRLLDMVGRPGGPLADAALWHLEVIEARPLSPSFRRVVVTAPGIEGLRCAPGQDLMLRIPLADDKVVNRRYTIRTFDPVERKVVVDVSLHGKGPGTDWISAAGMGDRIDAVGPRGKITLRPDADWHLFVVDETGVPGTLAMIEALPPGSVAIALLEVDGPADEQEPEASRGDRLDMQWLHRSGRSVPGDPDLVLEAVASLDLPAGAGHVYVAAEAGVVRGVTRTLTGRGLQPDQISGKAYWRRGLPNAEHGEPTRES